MKRILTVQDISCFGKCSITIALPLLSAMGIETTILPTAVLSTHTMFKGFTFKDLSDQLRPIADHWKKEGISFDAIYTGYLGTEEEIDTVTDIVNSFRGDETMVIIDPVMGDNGKLYSAITESYSKKNASLCALADVCVPNITEAACFTGMPYRTEYDESYIREMLLKLSEMGTAVPVITGVSLSEGKIGAMGYDTAAKEFFSYQNERVPASFHGTGDVFSSVLAGAFVLGMSRAETIKTASDFTALTIQETIKTGEDPKYGVSFEKAIPALVRMVSRYQ